MAPFVRMSLRKLSSTLAIEKLHSLAQNLGWAADGCGKRGVRAGAVRPPIHRTGPERNPREGRSGPTPRQDSGEKGIWRRCG